MLTVGFGRWDLGLVMILYDSDGDMILAMILYDSRWFDVWLMR